MTNFRCRPHWKPFVALIAFGAACIAQMAAWERGAPAQSLGYCEGGFEYSNRKCLTTVSSCAQVGQCVTLDTAYDCGTGYSCPLGGCVAFKSSNTITSGYCNDWTGATCTECLPLYCATGTMYPSLVNCQMSQNAQCTGFLKSYNACKP